MQQSSNKCWGRLVLSVFYLAVCSGETAQSATNVICLPSESIARALVDLALQAKISISDSGLDFRDRVTHPICGAFTPAEALETILAGTGYGFDLLDPDTVRIRALAPPKDAAVLAAEVVVVTATKREEVAQKLPYSLTVIQGHQLEDLGAQTPNDLTTQVVGLTASNLGAGEDKLFVRGLNDSVLPGFSNSMIGTYLDESSVAVNAPDPNLRLIDIDRVEVLRGPQGTLYGEGTLGGLLRVVTRQPVLDEFQEMVSVSGSTTQNGARSDGVDAMLNVPIVTDALALRAVGYIQNDGGYLSDIRLGLKNTNRTLTKGGRIGLAWQFNPTWLITAETTFQEINAADSQYYETGLPRLERSNYLQEPHSDRFLQGSIIAEGELGWANLVSASSIVDRRLDTRFDASLGWPQLTGFPLGPSPFDYARHILTVTQETRLTSVDDGRWKWLVGILLSYGDEGFQSSLSGPNATGLPIIARSETRDDRTSEAALFGEATYHFTDQLSLIAGARVFYASRSTSASTTTIIVIPPGNFRFTGASRQHGITPKLILSYEPTQDMMFYAQLSEGYRPGGFNIDGPSGVIVDEKGGNPDDGRVFDSDTLWNYELGSKMNILDERVTASAATYFSVWRNAQTDQVGSDGSFYIVNAGTVNDVGFEFELNVRFSEHLSLQGNFSWNNTTFINPNPILVQSEGVLPAAPPVTFGLSGIYSIPIEEGLEAFLSFDYGYVGQSRLGFNENNSPAMGGYGLANVRIGVRRGEWEAVLFVNNIGNEDANTFAFGNPFDVGTVRQITPPRPRTVGVSLNWAR